MYAEDGLAGIVKRAKKCRENDRQWYILYEDLARYFHPNRQGFMTEHVRGSDLYDDLWNSTPEQAKSRLAEALVAAMCPKDRMWPGVRPARDELMQAPHIRMWLQTVSKAMYKILYDPRVNFTEGMLELAEDCLAFGTGVPYVDHDKVNRHIVFTIKHLKQFSFEIGPTGKVTRLYCFWSMTIEDMVDMFGLEALPHEMRDKYNQGDYNKADTQEVLHAILPNEDFARYGLAPGRLPLASLWILCKGNVLLDQGGYYEMPYPVTRWYRRSDEARGRTPAMQALADARLLQAVSLALLEITEKQGNPPMQGPVDILRGEVELFPGGFTPFDASGFQFQGDPLRPVQIGANPALTGEYLQYLEDKIGKAFFSEVFSGPDGDGKMSEEEKLAAMQSQAARIAPVFSRVENELLPPIMDRVFSLAVRGGAFPPIPQELEGEQLIWVFDNHIADMREMAEAQRIMQALAGGLQFEREEAIENIDWDVAFRDLYVKQKVPEEYIRPIEAVMADRQQREQMQQAALMAQVAKDGGPGMKQAIEGAVQARDQGLLPPPA